MKRISHSCPLPNFIFNLEEGIDSLAEKLVRGSLLSMFRKLHPEKSSWNLSLVNLAVTNMAETGGESKTASGRDIGHMLRRQEDVLKDFRVIDTHDDVLEGNGTGSPAFDAVENDTNGDFWDDEDGHEVATEFCSYCGSHIPTFALVAHQRFHSPAVQ
jgi:DNA polymerase iota